MKHLLVITAALVVLTPLAAHAQERMSDARYLAANRCLAYAELGELQGDAVDFGALRSAVEVGNRERTIVSQVRQNTRAIRARATTLSAEELRQRRNDACAGFAERGLVQLGGPGAS
jgi:hypothetical protein